MTVSFWKFDEDEESVEQKAAETLKSKVRSFIQINDFSNIHSVIIVTESGNICVFDGGKLMYDYHQHIKKRSTPTIALSKETIVDVKFGFEFIYFKNEEEKIFKLPISQLGKITTLDQPFFPSDLSEFEAFIERTQDFFEFFQTVLSIDKAVILGHDKILSIFDIATGKARHIFARPELIKPIMGIELDEIDKTYLNKQGHPCDTYDLMIS